MNELNKLTNVIGKLDKLVHKQNCSHDFFLYFINYNIIIVQVIYINIETKEVVRIGYNGFLFPHSYSGDRFTKVIVNRKSKITLKISLRVRIRAFH